jgi:hypothetical protein
MIRQIGRLLHPADGLNNIIKPGSFYEEFKRADFVV